MKTPAHKDENDNPFLTQSGLLCLHANAQAAFDNASFDGQRTHLSHVLQSLIKLAEHFGPTPALIQAKPSDLVSQLSV